MHFERHGRTYQLRIQGPAELEQVLALDDSLWVAMSAPVAGLNCDAEFLNFVDLDDNQRIRADELRAAIRWLLGRLAERSHLAEGADRVEVDWIDPEGAGGRRCREAADYILSTLGHSDRAIDLARIQQFQSSLDSSVINGDRPRSGRE
ncbi:MAG: hypothetical protein ACYS1C_11775 [Planctomycetota bacterium]|jgi:hypothetical protein